MPNSHINMLTRQQALVCHYITAELFIHVYTVHKDVSFNYSKYFINKK